MAKLMSRPELVTVPARGADLTGDLCAPPGARVVVVFAHGSGGARLNPPSRFVAAALQRRGLATLLIDLLTRPEERKDGPSGALRYDIPLLAGRLDAVSTWLRARRDTRGLSLSYFGESTGAAAALLAAAARPDVRSIVSSGGRPDLAVEVLARVRAPTLLIVGGDDREVLAMNEVAASLMTAERALKIVPGAGRPIEDPGALSAIASSAGDWVLSRLP